MIKLQAAAAIPSSLTVLGRSLLLISIQVAANAVCLAVAARSHAILGLAVLAWTIGLRHALDADHIRLAYQRRPGAFAIDNATRTLINHGRLAITCGLFFSLGHSTIVLVVNVALVISTSIYNKLGGVSNVGSILGTAISGCFLFVVGLANSVILCKIMRRRRQARRVRDSERGEADPELPPNENMLMMRLLGPLVNFVDRPWKMYPVGVLFGLGFDTASSVALLAISALARGGARHTRISPSDVIILPLLFTSGMCMIDSLDSILMFYSYTEFAYHSWRIFEPGDLLSRAGDARSLNMHEMSLAGEGADAVAPVNQPRGAIETKDEPANAMENKTAEKAAHDGTGARREHGDHMVLIKRSTMSHLSIVLTTMSIVLAFSMSLVEIMGLVGANCTKCRAAASAPDGGGLAGAWWRFWAEANDKYGYIGAGIVGTFIVTVGGWYMAKWSCAGVRTGAASTS